VVCGQCSEYGDVYVFIGKGVGRYTLSEALFTVYNGAGRGGGGGTIIHYQRRCLVLLGAYHMWCVVNVCEYGDVYVCFLAAEAKDATDALKLINWMR